MRNFKKITVRIYEDQINTPIDKVDTKLVMDRFMTCETASTNSKESASTKMPAPKKKKGASSKIEKVPLDFYKKPKEKHYGPAFLND